MFGVRCSVFDVRCSMFGVRCSVFDVRCSMFGVRCSVFDVRCSMFGVRCSVFDVRCSVFGVRCWMFGARSLMFSQFIKWASFVKLSHTVFALPFALASMVVAARDQRGWPGWRTFGLILAAMVCARTCAMSFNRIVDRHFDKANPRTASRHLATGAISLASAWVLCWLSGFGLVVASYFINPICFYLSPVALFVVCFYSLTKRFTDFTHIFLGLALALAPIGAWLAVRGSIHITPVILALAVVCWLVGFDIIYALQYYEFDRTNNLHS